ncbi:MAG: tRNA (adenosine(37)-N6)-threonylcarbamoyltransferase complex dimerization subunit type 1 TsaB [bacterium]|nr:tRNA (adenosine(37)-N6)-threonylcarbamoyltransferase complex dimerization subunit type 1 TsaB [bacterium]
MILAIDVSATNGLLTLEVGGDVLTRVSDKPREHTTFLDDALRDLRRETGRPWSELSRVAVTIGPGSFTGLRVGLATAKGLVFGRDIPLAPLASLLIPAWALPEFAQTPCLTVRRARGGEVWGSLCRPGAMTPEWSRLLDLAALNAEAASLATETPEAIILGEPPAGFADASPLTIRPEPETDLQLAALASLARESDNALLGAELDRLLPDYLLEPAVTLPRPKPPAAERS